MQRRLCRTELLSFLFASRPNDLGGRRKVVATYGDAGVSREQWDVIKISRSRLNQIGIV